MKNIGSLNTLEKLLAREGGRVQAHDKAPTAKLLQSVRRELLEHAREVARSGDLPLIVATERAIIGNELKLYANSPQMTSSLKTALTEIEVIERHIGIVDNPARYKEVDLAYPLAKQRKGNLPFDAARQALASHYARLNNLDRARLDDDEKKIIDARRTAVASAIKLYTARQASALGLLTRGHEAERANEATPNPRAISLSALGDRRAYKRAQSPAKPALTPEQQDALRERLGKQAQSADAKQRPGPDDDPSPGR